MTLFTHNPWLCAQDLLLRTEVQIEGGCYRVFCSRSDIPAIDVAELYEDKVLVTVTSCLLRILIQIAIHQWCSQVEITIKAW